MKRSLSTSALAVALTVAGACGAHAADVVQPIQPIPEPALPVFSWAGPYAGLHAGYGWADRDWNGTVFAAPIPDDLFQYDMRGALLGAQIGYNWQWNNFVLGVEADAAWSNVDEEHTETVFVPVDTEVRMEWLATIRGRAGFALDRILLYGTGGVAFAGVDSDVSLAIPGGPAASDSASATHTGWTVGLGAEAMLTDRLSFKIEYLYADFGEEDFDYSLFGGPDETLGSADLELNTVRVGINYHF